MKRGSARLAVVPCVVVLGLAAMSCSGSPTSPAPAVASGQPGLTSSTPNTTMGQGTSSTPAAAGGQIRVDVCHFDADARTWSKLVVPANAAAAHLSHHNDARPGNPAPDGTPLDASCARVACPCYDTTYVIGLFQPGEPSRNLTCGLSFAAGWIHDLDAEREPKYIVESWLTSQNVYECYKDTMPPGDPAAIRHTISELQHRACVQVIGAAQLALGCAS